METFDRYSQMRDGSSIGIVPFAEIPKKDTDAYEVYHKGQTRLDLLSYQYYDSADYAWLILQANPEYGSMEFEIPDGSLLRIPYPLSVSIQDYQAAIEKHKKYYN